MMSEADIIKPAGIARIVYKQILYGDLKKFQAQSNNSPTGGGARDLRFSPFTKFGPVFKKLFFLNNNNGVYSGEFYSIEEGKKIIRPVYFHSPTSARPHEGRIANVDKCLPLHNIPPYEEAVILLIIQRDDRSVWPHFTTNRSLGSDDWNPMVANVILSCFVANRRYGVSMVGFVDFETNEVYCNGE